MARYRKIDPRIWNDEKFRALSDNGKLVFLMLLTHPQMTAIGAMRATMPGLAAELGWELEAFREAFREAFAKGMAEHDEKACLIALPKFVRYNAPESPNVVKAWDSALDLLPECSLKNLVIQRAKAFAEGLSKAFAEALPEAFAKAMPYQEQEQEQEQDKSSSSLRSDLGPQREPLLTPPPSPSVGNVRPHPASERTCQIVLDAYHDLLPRCLRVEVLNPKRKKRILAADKLARQVCRDQGWDYDADGFWRAYFGQCAQDAWLRGDVPNPHNPKWKQHLGVLLDEDRFAAVMDRAISGMREADAA